MNINSSENLITPHDGHGNNQKLGAPTTGIEFDPVGGVIPAPHINMANVNRNGPHGWPSWKQIRTGEHPVARYHRRNNIMSIALPPKDKGD